jgi:hypothetical protein
MQGTCKNKDKNKDKNKNQNKNLAQLNSAN